MKFRLEGSLEGHIERSFDREPVPDSIDKTLSLISDIECPDDELIEYYRKIIEARYSKKPKSPESSIESGIELGNPLYVPSAPDKSDDVQDMVDEHLSSSSDSSSLDDSKAPRL